MGKNWGFLTQDTQNWVFAIYQAIQRHPTSKCLPCIELTIMLRNETQKKSHVRKHQRENQKWSQTFNRLSQEMCAWAPAPPPPPWRPPRARPAGASTSPGHRPTSLQGARRQTGDGSHWCRTWGKDRLSQKGQRKHL